MKIVKISSKGQITLPRSLLAKFDLALYDKMLIGEDEEKIVLKPLISSIAEELAGSLNKYIHPSKLGVPFDKIMKETKKKVALHLALKK